MSPLIMLIANSGYIIENNGHIDKRRASCPIYMWRYLELQNKAALCRHAAAPRRTAPRQPRPYRQGATSARDSDVRDYLFTSAGEIYVSRSYSKTEIYYSSINYTLIEQDR